MIHFHFRDLMFLLAAQASICLQPTNANVAGEGSTESRERFRPHMVLPTATDGEGKYDSADKIASSVTCAGDITHEYVKIAILGGGMAGVAACAVLEEKVADHDIDYVLIEARDRLGGRMRSSKTADNDTFELGANWIEAAIGECDVSPVFKLAVNYGLQVFKQDFRDWYTFNNSTRGRPGEVNKYRVERVMNKFQKALECVSENAEDYWKDMDRNKHDENRDQGLRQELKDCGWEAGNPLKKKVENFFLIYEYARDPEHISLAALPEATNYGLQRYLVTDPRGYQYLPERHAQEKCDQTKIMRGREVYSVTYNSGGTTPVTVRTVDTSGNGNCTDYHVDKVIPTFSVGVLENRPDLFDDYFNITKQNVYEMARYLKVFFHFADKFWNDTTQFISVLTDRGRDCGLWQSLDREPTISRGLSGGNIAQESKTGKGGSRLSKSQLRRRYLSGKGGKGGKGGSEECDEECDSVSYSEDMLNLTDSIMPGSNLIFCTITTDAIDEYYNGAVSEEDAMGFLESLKAVFGNFSDPLNIIIPNWIDDPWTFGAYENWLDGKDYQDYKKFVKPRRDESDTKVIFPSGSHTCQNYWGTVHGAFLAGERAANKVLRNCGVKEGVPKDSICDE